MGLLLTGKLVSGKNIIQRPQTNKKRFESESLVIFLTASFVHKCGNNNFGRKSQETRIMLLHHSLR